jgi:hypothetical protein
VAGLVLGALAGLVAIAIIEATADSVFSRETRV